jgi:Membrane proteins related to metalloendopeptidases
MPAKGPLPPPPPDPEEPPPPPPIGLWTHPLPGAVITSPYGPRSFDFHYGVDLSSTSGDVGNPVLAVTALRVTVARDMNGNQSAGVYVKGHTFDGAYTFTYAHGTPGTLNVFDGQEIPVGHQLFIEGHSGNAFGTHCHFECYDGVQFDPWAPPWGNPRDPVPVLAANGVYL